MRARRVSVALAVVVSLVVSLAARGASAQKAPEKKREPKKEAAADPKLALAPAIAKLKSEDEAQIRSALDDARMAGPGAAALGAPIAEVLKRGASLSLTVAAIETLGDIEAEAGSAVLAQYASHRSTKVRRAALKSLTRTKGQAAAAAFRRALGDPDAIARATAASGLGAIKAKDAVPELFSALDHRVNEAAASIGQLCGAEQCAELAGKLGKLPFDVAVSGLDPVLFRPPAEVPDDVKVKIVGRVRELGTIEANKFLKDVQKRWPAAWSGRVRQAIDQAVLATSGGAQ